MTPSGILFFRSSAEFGRWLEKNHARRTELWVGYYKKETGRPSLSWSEAVDEALCHGWIDGIRKSIDSRRYTNRFTPRKPGSNWSAINIRKVKVLMASGRMRPAGLAAFRARRSDRSGVYSFEQDAPRLPAAYERILKKNPAAWAFFRTRTDWYRRTASWWVVSAKREETRRRRLDVLIARSEARLPIPALPRAPEARPAK